MDCSQGSSGQGSYRIFSIIFPEFFMISTHFSLSFLIKIDMFFLSLLFVNYKRYECRAGGTTCNDLPAAVDLGGDVLSPPVDPGQSPGGGRGGKPSEALEILQLTLAKKMPKIHPRGTFTLNYNFVD